ncbi:MULTISPECIES: hypothetical protein [Moorena]|nr:MULTISPECIES: hypothetical protein [Moorena]NEP32760.1 hypothetical protein [Moorena sp. SIO3B2]NEQ12312.1 hypothetical protein [Moorena sp. SIO4E2]NER87641.1 hypothetical protein [Moorena sp. SIO3A2]
MKPYSFTFYMGDGGHFFGSQSICSELKKLESLEIQENQVLGKTHHHVMLNLPGHEKKYRNSFI